MSAPETYLPPTPLLAPDSVGRGASPNRGTWVMRRRFSVAFAVAVLVASGLFVFAANPAVAPSKMWTSDADFSGGTFAGTRVVGTGPGASIELAIYPTPHWGNMGPTGGPAPRAEEG